MKTTSRILFIGIICVAASLVLASYGCDSGSNTNTNGSTNTGSSSGTGNPGDAVAIDFSWGTEFTATQAWMEAKAEEIKTVFAPDLWKATEGQLYFRTQTFTNGDAGAKVRYVNPSSHGFDAGASGSTTFGGGTFYIRLAGLAPSDTILHEFCHGQFNKLTEEYDCGVCVMGLLNGTRRAHYCNANDCTTSHSNAACCWENFILKKYPSWTNTGRNPGAAPACTVIIK